MTNVDAAIRALSALGDPTRRRLFERLAASPSSVGELAKTTPVTRSAVSQHLRVLKEAGLVTETPQGTRRIYRLDPAGLAAVRDWLDGQWDMALDAFGAFADEETKAEEEEQ
jgi:DNA-binding transcriptional ArsR family regulator